MLLDITSLAKTIENVNESLFFGTPIPQPEQETVTQWIAGRLGLKGSYRGLFAPTPKDFATPATLLMGETLKTGASTAHILGEESMQILKKLPSKDKVVKKALESARDITESFVGEHEVLQGHRAGMFCCGKCSVAYWRSLSSGCLPYAEERLDRGLKTLKALRDGSGKWRRFPFYYTLLALSEIDHPGVLDEFKYSIKPIERMLKKTTASDTYYQRRKRLAEKILSKL